PADRFAAVSRRLVQDGAAVLVLGAASERGLGDAVAAGLGRRAVNAAGMTTMREAMALMARCGHVVTNDSGPMHVAAALGVPVTAVFGPTEPRATSPVGERVTILQRPVDCAPCRYRECPIDHRCMTGVGVDEVYTAVASAASTNPLVPPLSRGGKGGFARDP
ncbi:MAG TPA: glycosyltransferase family 9 protein, partial [Nitrospiria bacterium]|nr:glycosyltransferase family 9 protein [Nitrospiria bacterium]